MEIGLYSGNLLMLVTAIATGYREGRKNTREEIKKVEEIVETLRWGTREVVLEPEKMSREYARATLHVLQYQTLREKLRISDESQGSDIAQFIIDPSNWNSATLGLVLGGFTGAMQGKTTGIITGAGIAVLFKTGYEIGSWKAVKEYINEHSNTDKEDP